jgi:hypothetical protein
VILSVGSSTLYMEFDNTLYTINTTTGAATQVGATDSNGVGTSALLLENGTLYIGNGAAGIGTMNATTGQVTSGSPISGGPSSAVGLAPDPLPAGKPPVMLTANAYMLGTAAQGVENPFGIVDLNSGAFTLIGNMGSGGYDGLAVANGALYTEQNGLLYSVNTANANLTLIGGVTGTPNLASFGSTTTGLYGLTGVGSSEVATLFSINPQTGAITAIGPTAPSPTVKLTIRGFPLVPARCTWNPTAIFTPSTRQPVRPRRWELPTVTAIYPPCCFSNMAPIMSPLVPALPPSTLPLARSISTPRFSEQRGPPSVLRPIR